MKERLIGLSLLAAVTIGVAPVFAQTSENTASLTNNEYIIADGMLPQKHVCRRVFKKCVTHKAQKRVVEKAAQIETKPIETPQAVAPAPVQTEQAAQTVEQPAVVEACQPVIIDRFEKRHRTLIHLGLFPLRLFGQ